MPIAVVAELVRQQDLADKIEQWPLIDRRVNLTMGLDDFIFGQLKPNIIFAIPGERKGNRTATFLDLVDSDQGPRRIGADGDSPLDTSGGDQQIQSQ